MKRKTYKVFDFLDMMTVGKYDTLEEAKKAYKDFYNDTDGECDLVIYKWIPSYGEYQMM